MSRIAALGAVVCLALAATPSLLPAGPAADSEIRVIAMVSGKFVAPLGAQPPGFDVELLRRFAAWYRLRTGKEVRFSYTYVAPVVPLVLEAIQKGSAEVGIGGVTATAERAKLVSFSTPTLPVRCVLIAPPEVLDPERWREQLPGLRLGANIGSTNAAAVERLAAVVPGVEVDNHFTTTEAVIDALAARPRTLDAAVVDLPLYWTIGKPRGLALIDNVSEPQGLAFVVAKGSPLLPLLDQFLEPFTHSKDYFLLIRRYFGQEAEQMVRISRGVR